MVNAPVVIIMVAMMVGSAALMIIYNSPIPLLGMLAGFVTAWLYWSIMITKWRIWALENVRNVHELKVRAIKEKLIWKDASFFEKTEIRTAADKQKLAALQDRFNSVDVFTDDFSVATETNICYSRNKILIEVFLGLIIAGAGAYIWAAHYNQAFGIVFCIVGAVIIFKATRKINNKAPQVTLSNKGIQTIKTQFYDWKDIDHEDVVAIQSDKSRIFCLMYNHPHGTEKLDISQFDVNRRQLEKLLRLYRDRYRQSELRAQAHG